MAVFRGPGGIKATNVIMQAHIHCRMIWFAQAVSMLFVVGTTHALLPPSKLLRVLLSLVCGAHSVVNHAGDWLTRLYIRLF